MEDGYVLEEGEACSSICEGFDPLDDLTYLDDRIENALGHLQKAFEGEVLSAELLGTKYGGYGTFLSSYEDSLPDLLLRGSSQRSPVVQRQSSSLPQKNSVCNLGSMRSASGKLKGHHDGQTKQDSGPPSIQSSGNVSLKTENAIMRANDASDHKPIRVRIKMGSEILSRKVAVVQRSLGLDDSPDSPPGNCHDDSRMFLHTSLDTPNESPSSILQEMTSVTVPNGLLMSPLSDILLHALDEPKKETVIVHERVVKVRKELPVLSPSISSEVLGNGNTLSGKKKRVVGSIDATTCKEVPSLEGIKKKNKFPTCQRARVNSTCGLGGASVKNVTSTFKHKLQKDINKDGENAQEVALKKSNKMNIAGVRLKDPFRINGEELKKASPAKSKETVCDDRLGAKLVSGAPLKDAAYVGHNNTDVGLGYGIAPPLTSLELDDWVQCDRCETWRLLPWGMKPEQLPDKWSCSMQFWLPKMNHCGLSQAETTNAVIGLRQNSGSKTHNSETGVIKLDSDAGRVDQSNQQLTSSSLPSRTKKKSTGKDLCKGNIVIAASSRRSNLRVPVQINTSENHRAGQISKAHGIGMSHGFDEDKYATDQKVKHPRAVTACQVHFKRKRVNDQQDSEKSKKTKDDEGNKRSKKVKLEKAPWILNLERNTAERSVKPSDTKKNVLAPKKKLDHQSQPTTGGDSLAEKANDKTIAPGKREKLMTFEDNYNGSVSGLLEEGANKASPYKKDITAKVAIAERKEMKTHQTNAMYKADGFREHAHSDPSCPYSLSERGSVSGIANLSSSKVLGSHKGGRAYAEELKASPVESISSSPAISRQNRLQDYPSESKADSLTVSLDNVLNNRAAIKKAGGLTQGNMDNVCQVANDVLIEANRLRKFAECLKSSGFECEHKKANFKASLKFLYGGSLLEMCSGENALNEKMKHVEAYRVAAKLSESCALEYEAKQEMAAAALAYKCMEVACMRVIYGRSLAASRDWNSLQKMLQMAPKGESPSSSASDIDNFNHQRVVVKSSFPTGGLPHIAGNHLHAARSQQNFVQLLDFAEDINLAMEASTKSQNALRAVTVTLEESQFKDTISSIERVVNFSFHNIEALIRQVELAMDAL